MLSFKEFTMRKEKNKIENGKAQSTYATIGLNKVQFSVAR